MDQIVHRLAHEGIAVEFRAKQIVPINADAATGGDSVYGAWIVEPFQGVADRVKQITIDPGGDGHARTGRRNVRVAAQIMIRDGIMPGGGAVIASQPVAPVIARSALLGEARSRLEGAGVGVHAEIATTDVHLN